jgi:cytidine deaminase
MRRDSFNLEKNEISKMTKEAWKAWEHAFVFGNTKVGATVMSSDGSIYSGCNVEHRFRSHDVHAEVNAITSMVTAGKTELIAIVIVAERDQFTPCGACMDWIFQFGGPSCLIAYQSERGGKIQQFLAKDLMPFYPK